MIPSLEIIIVDDGSNDGTLDIARSLSRSDIRVKVLARTHLGKGAAVKEGMLNATGEFILFMDADGATPLNEIRKLLQKMEEGYPVAIGSRVVVNPKETKVVSSFHRIFLGRIFSKAVNILAVPGIRDTQCGFKMFRKDAAKALFAMQKCKGFAFDVEILFLAKRMSLSVAEVPINWAAQQGSKVNLFTDSCKMFMDILKIRQVHRNK
jgi:dolichyl-phosphate beta-glucosyltransferase